MRFLHVRQARHHMATTFTFTIACPDDRASAARQVLEEAHAEVARLERELSEFLKDSPVARWNASLAGEAVEFTADGLGLWRLSVRMSKETSGAFHPLAKSQPPGNCDEVQQVGNQLVKSRAGLWMGFGAIGKGFALDKVRALVEQAGFTDYLLSAGGSSQILSGFSSPGDPWCWGWSWKKDEVGDALGIPLLHASGVPIALGVSGFHEKGRHILDPKTGLAIPVWAHSACIAAPSAAEADALSTALMVSEGKSVHGETAKAVIDGEGVPHWNEGFQKLWGALASFLFLWLLAWPTLAAAADELEITEEAVDLTSLGVQSFMPYSLDRQSLWILLPLVSLFFVMLHLMKGPRKKIQLKTVDPGRDE